MAKWKKKTMIDLLNTTQETKDWATRTNFKQYFSYIVAVSFIDGGKRGTQRKPSNCRKSLINFIRYHKEFCFSLIGLNSIFSTLPQSEYTSRAVSTPRVRYIRVCVYFCLFSIRCFSDVQPETRFHFQSANQIAKMVKMDQKFQNFKIIKLNFYFFFKVQNFQKNSKFLKISKCNLF
jgi:hypothetical protein